MITDLSAQNVGERTLDVDVAIVGAGVAGLILATRLCRGGLRVVILESGGLAQLSETHSLNRVVQLGDPYVGASNGRFRCLGGTSTRWGGALIPFLVHDLSPRPYLHSFHFPISLDEINRYLGELEDAFSIDSKSYEEEFVREIGATKYVPTGDAEFRMRFAKWPPFRKRNIAKLYGDELKNDHRLEVVLNATVTKLAVDKEAGRMSSVTARQQGGRAVTVIAGKFVICAGAIETTRLLLLLNRQNNERVIPVSAGLGHYFFDHVSTKIATIGAKNVVKLNRLAGFRFVGSTMRSLRFELSPEAQKRERVGSAFGHISFKTDGLTGFDCLRQVLRGAQRGEGFRFTVLLDALAELPYFGRLVLWRAVYRQLLWPTPASYEVHVVAEQLPRFDNYIALAPDEDVFGVPLAAINWRVSNEDRRTFDVFERLYSQYWERRGLNLLGELRWEQQSNSYPISGADVFHPGGSTRMGTQSRLAVLDSNLRVFGMRNLWAASTAAFPCGGGANPTLTLMLLCLRLGDHLTGSALSAA